MRRAEDFDTKWTPEPNSGCWLWTGALNRAGYGTLGSRLAHRLSFERAGNALVPGLVIDHLCRCRCCVNPKHMRQVTSRENTLAPGSLVSAHCIARTHCPSGHEYSAENTRLYQGRRYCRACGYRRLLEFCARRMAAK